MSKPIAKSGSKYWHYDFVVEGRRFHGSTRLKGKREAQAFIDRLRHDALLPDRQRPPITLDEACGLYQDHAESLPSWQTKRYIIEAMIKGLPKDKFLHEITQRHLMAYVSGRRRGRKNATVNRELNTVIAVWNRAARARFNVGEMPDWKGLKLKVTRRTHRLLAVDEQKPLMEEVREDVRPAVEFLLMSGWRRAEVIGLRWTDVDLRARTAMTRIKGGDTVTRPLTNEMVALLANQPKVGPFVFTYICRRNSNRIRTSGERYPLTVTVLRSAWAAAQSEAGLSQPIRIHDLRHTRATRILRATGNLAAVKRALEHRDIRTTLQYAHVLDEDVRAALDASESRTIPEVTGLKSQKA